MDAIILAAGYATRLYPLTENTPKPLLNIAGKPIIEHIIKKLEQINLINKIYVVTNDKFEQHFRKWLSNFNAEKPIEIINDRTKSNEGRLGALGDIHYTINLKNINSEIVVIAGDNIFEDSLADSVNFFKKRKSTLASTGIYLFPKKTISLIKKYIAQGNNPDKTGSFIEWLHKRDVVYSYITDKGWYDIGSVEQLEKADKKYGKTAR